MTYENKKIAKIVDEILTYLMENDAQNIKVEITKFPKYVIIATNSENVKLSDEKINDLKNYLNSTHREVEMEEYYWSLAGEGHASDELALVAIMVDIAEIYYEGTTLRMDLLRKLPYED